jgi:hypothetical protein
VDLAAAQLDLELLRSSILGQQAHVAMRAASDQDEATVDLIGQRPAALFDLQAEDLGFVRHRVSS